MHKIGILLITTFILSVSGLRKTCSLGKLKNGRVLYRSRTGGFAQFQCKKGYLLAGEKYTKCVNGSWEGEQPHCVRNTCSKARAPENGFMYQSHRGAVLIYFCKAGYELKGTSTVYCDGEKWSSPLPPCIASEKNVSLNCDFEREDLCGWTHDINHDFDWTRMQFSTPSGHIGTGPSYDHTSGEGYYMYIEATSRNINDTARLISPVYEKQLNNTCLEFFYHMHGSTTGELRAYLKKTNDSWDLKVENAIFRKSGNQGNQWRRSLIHLGNIDEDFQVVLEGIRGSSYASDIAIDDVRIIENCDESEEEEITTNTIGYSTEDVYLGDYSCVSRCDSYDNSFPCSCSNGCILNNTCCVDYIAACILGDDTDFQTTEDVINETTDRGTSSMDNENDNTTSGETIALTDYTTVTTLKPTKKVIIVPPPSPPKQVIIVPPPAPPKQAINVPPAAPPKQVINVPPKKVIITPPRQVIIKPPTKIINTPTKANATLNEHVSAANSSSNNNRVIIISQKPANPPIRIKVVTTSTVPKVPTKQPTKVDQKQNEPLPNEKAKNDMAILPVNGNNDEELLVTQRFKETKLARQQIVQATTGGKSTIIIIAVVSIAIGIVVTLVVLRRRYMCVRFKNIRSKSYGDSQSDVRFLTSDEVLDFTLATN